MGRFAGIFLLCHTDARSNVSALGGSFGFVDLLWQHGREIGTSLYEGSGHTANTHSLSYIHCGYAYVCSQFLLPRQGPAQGYTPIGYYVMEYAAKVSGIRYPGRHIL